MAFDLSQINLKIRSAALLNFFGASQRLFRGFPLLGRFGGPRQHLAVRGQELAQVGQIGATNLFRQSTQHRPVIECTDHVKIGQRQDSPNRGPPRGADGADGAVRASPRRATPWRKGDKLRPLGHTRYRTRSDATIPAGQRTSLLCSGGL